MPPNLQDGETSPPAKSTDGAIGTWPGGFPTSSNLGTSRLPILPGLEHWITSYSPGASLARTSVPLEKERASKGLRVAFGDTITGELKKFYLDMRSLKIREGLIVGGLNKSYMTFTKSGMMQNGKIFQLPNLEHPIKGNEHGFLPTPLASDGRACYTLSKQRAEASLKRLGRENAQHWMIAAILFYNYPKAMANPRFSEIMMGLPKDWTQLTDSEPSVMPCIGPSLTPSSDG